MSVMAGELNRSEDWVFVAVVLAIFYIALYPAYVLLLRHQHARRIKKQLVTSAYKLPFSLSPTELAYIFSSRVGKKQLFSTLLDLANRSILVFSSKAGVIYVAVGPKIETNLSHHEQILFDSVQEAHDPVPVDRVLQGHTVKEYKKNTISGSRNYVYWWFLRQQLRDRKIIGKNMIRHNSRMLITFGALLSLLLVVVSMFSWQTIVMALGGEVDFSHIFEHVMNGLLAWAAFLIPVLVLSFLGLRFRGKMLGRYWILTPSNQRYINQIIAYREFVRLTHKDRLRFESKELEKHVQLGTKAYALALGIIDK